MDPDPDFLKRLRDLTTRLGIVLIYDEVKTGFRISLGGAQEFYGVRPDLTALGKVLGGGFPVGLVGGKRSIMELASPLLSPKREEIVFHSGTFNGNPISMAAGLATIRYLAEPGRFESLVQRTNQLRQGIEQLAGNYHLPLQTLGLGTIFNVLFTQAEVHNYRDLAANSQKWRLALDFFLMENGVYTKPLNRFSMSDAHGQAEIANTLRAFEISFDKLKKFIL